MAPFQGVKGRAQGSYEKSARNSDRNSHYAQAGRGRRARGGLKSSFSSSRVDDQTQDDAEQHSKETSKLDDDDDDGEEAAATAVKPYSVLLQSLNEISQRGQPSRKKQKKNDFEVVENIDTGEKDLDLVLEPEEVGNFGTEELIDDGDDEIDEGMS
ncbi:hypothetical protein MMC31_001261 [Peltigera leucophlebia]|nr:hypothetical protein [Peltigera leucophlebia]